MDERNGKRGQTRTIEKYEELCKIVIDSLIWRGETAVSLSREIGVSRADISEILNALKFAKCGDTAGMLDRITKRGNAIPPNLVLAAYKTVGAETPLPVQKVLEEKAKAKKEINEDNLAKGRISRKQGECENTPLWAQSMLLNQAKIISLLEDMIDACVPKYVGDIVESNAKIDTHLVQLINKLS